jgi:hypothetical protein
MPVILDEPGRSALRTRVILVMAIQRSIKGPPSVRTCCCRADVMFNILGRAEVQYFLDVLQ